MRGVVRVISNGHPGGLPTVRKFMGKWTCAYRPWLSGLLLACVVQLSSAQTDRVATYPEPDDRFKTDILLIVPHPDDETAVGGYLAQAIFDQGKTVSIIYCNRGDGGGNTTGVEQSLSLGAVREIEARRAAAEFGITNVWFLDGRDTPGQDVFHSLQNMNHGATLERIVRLIRLTRPEVVFTWLPHFVSGENHGDHQAVGVMATEAFDLAGDPTVFPTQVTPPREPLDIGNFNEGLRPWQPKKIYYFSDAERPIQADGPPFDLNEVSPSKNLPYYRLAADLHKHHLTQGEVAQVAITALETGEWSDFIEWMSRYRLIFGKSVVRCKPDGSMFDGIQPGPHPFDSIKGYEPIKRAGVSLELGGAFAFYKDFWRAHGIEHIGPLVEPEIMIAAGSYTHIPLLLGNYSNRQVEVELRSSTPEGWTELSGSGTYQLNPGDTYPVQTFFIAPSEVTKKSHIVTWEARVGQRRIGTVHLKVDLREWTLPQ